MFQVTAETEDRHFTDRELAAFVLNRPVAETREREAPLTSVNAQGWHRWERLTWAIRDHADALELYQDLELVDPDGRCCLSMVCVDDEESVEYWSAALYPSEAVDHA